MWDSRVAWFAEARALLEIQMYLPLFVPKLFNLGAPSATFQQQCEVGSTERIMAISGLESTVVTHSFLFPPVELKKS